MPECVQCGENYPASEMRRVEWEHRVGSTYGRSSGSRTGSGNSYSFSNRGNVRYGHSNSQRRSSRTTKRDQTRVDRVWVCNDCKPPRNYGWFQRVLTFWAIVAAVIYFGFQWMSQKVSLTSAPATTERSDTPRSPTGYSDPPEPTAAERRSDIESPLAAKPKPQPSVIFAAPKEVVQPLDDQSDQPVVKCSDTVKDHCNE